MSVENNIAHELELIRRRHGGFLRPVDVVEFARDPATALHARFEWDDSRAADQYRLEQARLIIRCTVRMVHRDAPPIHAYVSLHDDRRAGDSYRSIVDVLADPRLRDQLLAQSLREAESWRMRYERLTELQPIARAINNVRRRHRLVKQVAARAR